MGTFSCSTTTTNSVPNSKKEKNQITTVLIKSKIKETNFVHRKSIEILFVLLTHKRMRCVEYEFAFSACVHSIRHKRNLNTQSTYCVLDR